MSVLWSGLFLTAAEFLIIAPHQFRKLLRNGVPVDRNEGVFGFTAGELFVNAIPDFGQGFGDFSPNHVPLRRFSILFELRAYVPRPVARSSDFIAQIWIIQEFFHIAEPVGPLCVLFASERAARTAVLSSAFASRSLLDRSARAARIL